MAKKEKEKKKKGGKTATTAGILAIIAALLGVGAFGFGGGAGSGTGTGNSANDNPNKDYLMQDNQMPTVLPPATVTPTEEEATVIQLTEVAVMVKGDKVVYNDTEYTAQELADLLDTEYADKKEQFLLRLIWKKRFTIP